MSTQTEARTTMVYEGKAKRIWHTPDSTLHIVEYTDRATAFNGEKHANIEHKGALNNQISAHFMELLHDAGIPTHFVRILSKIEQLVRAVTIVPLEVVVRNIVAGSLAARSGLDEGAHIDQPVVEFYYKRDDLGDPLLTRAHIGMLGLADDTTLDTLTTLALSTNTVLRQYLETCGVTLVDFKLEFGHTAEGELLLADEISPDTCRFWDSATGRKLDKDRFRRDMGDVGEAYAELLSRLVPDAITVGSAS